MTTSAACFYLCITSQRRLVSSVRACKSSNTGIRLVPKAAEVFVPKCLWFMVLITGGELCLTVGACSYFSRVRTLNKELHTFPRVLSMSIPTTVPWTYL